MTCSYRNMGPQDLTHLYVLKETILCCFPNCAFITIPTYGRPIHWEQYQKSWSQNIRDSESPKTDDLSKKKTNCILKAKNGAIGQVTVGSKQNPVLYIKVSLKQN